MFSWLTNAWRVPELRRRVLFTALILAIYRLGSWLPAPGGNSDKINQYTRYLTVALAAAQSTGYAFLFKRSHALEANAGRFVLIILTLTAGTTLLMWMGELITKRGVGNGISLLIFASILATAPSGVSAWINGGPMEKLFFPLIAVGIIAVIFAAAIMAFPPTIAQFFPQTQGFINSHFMPSNLPYLLLEGFLIVVFTYFYTAVQFNPVDQADNLRKYGGYIPGIRPGPPTAQYLDRVLTRLTLPGSLYLALIAVLPSLFIRYGGFSQATSRALGGTSVLIVVGVALDTMRQMESQMMMRSYEGFLK